MKYIKYLLILFLVFFLGCTTTNSNNTDDRIATVSMNETIDFYDKIEVSGSVDIAKRDAVFGFYIATTLIDADHINTFNVKWTDGLDSDNNFYTELDDIDYHQTYYIYALVKENGNITASNNYITLNVFEYVKAKKESADYVKNKLMDKIYREYLNEMPITFKYELDGGTCDELSSWFIGLGKTLPTPIKEGYDFLGWRFSNDNEVRTSYPGYNYYIDEITLTALWEKIPVMRKNLKEVMSIIPSYINTDFEVMLPDADTDVVYKWTTSDRKVFAITVNKASVSINNFTHNEQKIMITLLATYSDDYEDMMEKEVTIAPIHFDNLPSTPVGTYFQTSAAETYRAQNKHYQETKSYFKDSSAEVLDIIYYAFIIPNSDGSVYLSDVSLAPVLTNLRKRGVRIVGSIAGVSGTISKYFAQITSNEEKLKVFVKNLMDLVEKYHFDGLDIDWESTSEQYVVASGMNALSKALREEMDKRTFPGATPYFLSAAVPASSWGTGSDRYDFPTLNNYLDYINIMSYDANKSTIASHLDPFYISSNDKGYGFGFVYGVEQISRLGFPKSKLMGGLAGYGKAYKISGTLNMSVQYPGLGLAATLTKIDGLVGSFDSGTLFGGAVCEIMTWGTYTKYTEYNNSGKLVASYLLNKDDKMFISYEDSDVIKEKYRYCDEVDGLGLMCWSYVEDTQDVVVDTLAIMKGIITE